MFQREEREREGGERERERERERESREREREICFEVLACTVERFRQRELPRVYSFWSVL